MFWTAGHRFDSSSWDWWPNRFMWCSLENSSELSTETVSWKSGQPENKGENPNCVQLRIHKYSTGSYTVISDQHCSSKFAFACQVKIIIIKIFKVSPNFYFQKAVSKQDSLGCIIPSCPLCERDVNIYSPVCYFTLIIFNWTASEFSQHQYLWKSLHSTKRYGAEILY